MAAAARTTAAFRFEPDEGTKGRLHADWIQQGRREPDFDVLWSIYWDELGPLAPVPRTIHELDEVLAR